MSKPLTVTEWLKDEMLFRSTWTEGVIEAYAEYFHSEKMKGKTEDAVEFAEWKDVYCTWQEGNWLIDKGIEDDEWFSNIRDLYQYWVKNIKGE